MYFVLEWSTRAATTMQTCKEAATMNVALHKQSLMSLIEWRITLLSAPRIWEQLWQHQFSYMDSASANDADIFAFDDYIALLHADRMAFLSGWAKADFVVLPLSSVLFDPKCINLQESFLTGARGLSRARRNPVSGELPKAITSHAYIMLVTMLH